MMTLVLATRLEVKQRAEGEHYERAEENHEGAAGSGIVVDLGYQVGGSDVDGDASGERKGVSDGAAKGQHHHSPGKSGHGQERSGGEGGTASASAGQHDGGDGKTFG